MIRTASITLFFFFALQNLYAQDANYWSAYYGPGGFFAPGAVIANNRDSGVLFYNPALLALSYKRTASITGTIYQMESIKMKEGAGRGKPLHSRITSSLPQMLSGSIAIRKKKKPVYISYALINTSVINFHASQRKDGKVNALGDSHSPGDEYFIGQVNLQNIIRETTAQVSAGFRLSPRLAAGITLEGQAHRQNNSTNVVARALVNNGGSGTSLPLASNEALYQVTYTHYGFRAKAGLSYEAAKHHLGLVITSPLVHAGGSGTLVADNAIANIRDAYSGTPLNALANTRQTHLKPKWKMPLSIAAGYAYDYAQGQLYIAAEYFTSISEYDIITPRNEYFLRPDTGDNNAITSALLRMKDSRKSVINVGIGASHAIRHNIMGYCSFRTDFTYADNDLYVNGTGYTPNTSIWNNFHCQLGANLRRQKYNLRAGLLLSYGQSGNYLQTVNFDSPTEDNYLLGNTTATRASHFTAGVMLSFIHNL